MHIALACAGRRGYRLLERLLELTPDSERTIFSFREEPHEPPFLDDIRNLCVRCGARFCETRRLEGPRARPMWETADVDLLLVAGWRYLIPAEVYSRPRAGTYVFHDSLLPRYRGFSPTVWAICNGEDHTGATLFAIADDVDSGAIIDQRRIPIGPTDTIADIAERVTAAYLTILASNIDNLLAGPVLGQAQDHRQATYVRKRAEIDNRINWSASPTHIYNLIRAVTVPYPGAFTDVGNRRLRVWSAALAPECLAPSYILPGTIVGQSADTVVVCAGDGGLILNRVQWDGEPPLPAGVALRSHVALAG